MVKIDGINKVRARLEAMRRRGAEADASVSVGYTQRYALFVHENLNARHPIGNAKYLEGPARRLAGTLGKIVTEVYKKTKSMVQSLLVVGLRLQRESQEEVPIDTGALKASAFTEED